jgi:hypothetical protein
MAGAGYRLFATGDVLTAAQVNTYLQQQTVMVFADSSARTSALSGVLAEGMVTYLQSDDTVYVYNGSAWVSIANSGDITSVGVTAPITGGGTSGAVTIGVDTATTAAVGVVQLTNSTSSTSTTTAAVPANVKTAYDLAAAAIATSTLTTAGDIIYRNSTIPTRLGIGTAGQVLTVNSGATAPQWSTPAGGGGGKVLQVVTAFKSDTFTTNSATYTDITGLSVTITPTLNTSKIYVIASVTGAGTQGQAPGMCQILRGATVIGSGDTAGSRVSGFAALGRSGGATEMASAVINYLDSPATTSATTYKVQTNALDSANTVFVNRCESNTDSGSRVRGSSTITVMEIGA